MFKKLFSAFLLLSALSGLFIALFPLVEIKLPALANGVNRFRGHYSGPLFSTVESNSANYFQENSSVIKSSMKNDQTFYFVPADDIEFDFSVYYNDHTNSPIELYLYKEEDGGSLLATNINTPYVQGRQAGAFSQQGEEMPEYGNWFTSECSEGILYALKVIPENTGELNRNFTVTIESSEGWISLPGLWGFFVSILLILLIAAIIFRFLWSVRAR